MISDYKKYEDALDSMIELYVENTQHLLDNGYSCTKLMPLYISGVRQLGTTSYIMKRLRIVDFFITTGNMVDQLGLRGISNVLVPSSRMFNNLRGRRFQYIKPNTNIFIYTDMLPKDYNINTLASEFYKYVPTLCDNNIKVRVISLGSC